MEEQVMGWMCKARGHMNECWLCVMGQIDDWIGYPQACICFVALLAQYAPSSSTLHRCGI
uniref:Uncharacterized protein n=1 Tax=Arundo donax TaxID=35708 RepID=A0A0A9AYG7_ARUDO